MTVLDIAWQLVADAAPIRCVRRNGETNETNGSGVFDLTGAEYRAPYWLNRRIKTPAPISLSSGAAFDEIGFMVIRERNATVPQMPPEEAPMAETVPNPDEEDEP